MNNYAASALTAKTADAILMLVSTYIQKGQQFMGTTKKVPSAVRREQILDAACELFAELGYSGTTTKQLAEKVGCSEAIIFRIFPTKEAIFETLFEEWKEAVMRQEEIEIIEGSALKTLKHFFAHVMQSEYVSSGNLVRSGWRRNDLGIAVTSRKGEEKWGRAFQEVQHKSNDVVRVTLAPVIWYGQQKGEIKEGEPELLAELFWAIVFGFAVIKEKFPERYIEAHFEDFVSLLLP